MYSLTRVSIARQLARMQIGISAVVRITNGSEMPSTPMRYVMVPASHGRFSTNWNSAENGSKRHATMSDTASVISVTHSATQRALRFTAASSPPIIMMKSAPTSGRNVVTERIGQLAISGLRSRT